jgi:hypothetical protein
MNTRKFSFLKFSGLLIAGGLAAGSAFSQATAVNAVPAVKTTVEQKAVDVKTKETTTVAMAKDAKKEVAAVTPGAVKADATVKATTSTKEVKANAKTHVAANHTSKVEKTAAVKTMSDGKMVTQTKTASKVEMKTTEKPIAKPVS